MDRCFDNRSGRQRWSLCDGGGRKRSVRSCGDLGRDARVTEPRNIAHPLALNVLYCGSRACAAYALGAITSRNLVIQFVRKRFEAPEIRSIRSTLSTDNALFNKHGQYFLRAPGMRIGHLSAPIVRIVRNGVDNRRIVPITGRPRRLQTVCLLRASGGRSDQNRYFLSNISRSTKIVDLRSAIRSSALCPSLHIPTSSRYGQERGANDAVRS